MATAARETGTPPRAPWFTMPWWRLVAWLVIGLCMYFGYSRIHSRQQQVAAE